LGQVAAIYCRVSTSDQNCERQEADLNAFAEKAGYAVAGVWKETASGSKADRRQRQQVLNLAQARKIGVCLIAQTGLQFDLATPQGKLIATLMAGLAEFERDLLRERVRSGVMAAQARGVVFGRRIGQRIKSDKLAPKVLALVAAGQSYRQIGRQLGLSKNTVLEIVKRKRANAGCD